MEKRSRVANKNRLDHITTVTSLLKTLQASTRMHGLIIEGPAGWGKTTAVFEAMQEASVSPVHLGNYSTPLHLFNFLSLHATDFVVIDDCAGLFGDPSSMAILKAATWGESAGRLIRWGSTTSRASTDEFVFQGKLVIVCNSFPKTADADAIRSRSFPFKVKITANDAKNLLLQAASDKARYTDTETAVAVAKFLASQISAASPRQISYRTLQMGYELAQYNPSHWQALLSDMIECGPEDPKKLIRKLASETTLVKDQLRVFEEVTGFKRRTFFKYRKEMALARK